MNRNHLVAALLCAVASVLRTIDGQTGPLRVARESSLDVAVVGFFHITWYKVTTVFVVSAGVLVVAALRPTEYGRQVGLVLGIVFIVWSLVIFVISSIFSWGVATIIPMVVTFAIGAFSLAGTRPFTVRGS